MKRTSGRKGKFAGYSWSQMPHLAADTCSVAREHVGCDFLFCLKVPLPLHQFMTPLSDP